MERAGSQRIGDEGEWGAGGGTRLGAGVLLRSGVVWGPGEGRASERSGKGLGKVRGWVVEASGH
jgi:hypothetical protein